MNQLSVEQLNEMNAQVIHTPYPCRQKEITKQTISIFFLSCLQLIYKLKRPFVLMTKGLLLN